MMRSPVRKQAAKRKSAAAMPSPVPESRSIGDNRPPPPAPLTPEQITAHLEFAYTDDAARARELIGTITAFANETAIIQSDAEQGRAAENVRMVREFERTADLHRQDAKRPYLAGGRAVDGWFGKLTDQFGKPILLIQTAMNAYAQKKFAAEQAAREEEMRQAREAAQRKIDEARRAVRDQPLAPLTDDMLREADEAEAEAQAAIERAQERPAAMTQVRGEHGAVASLRTNWGWQINDFSKVPDIYKMLNQQQVRLAMQRRDPVTGRPLADIPGLEWVPERSVQVR